MSFVAVSSSRTMAGAARIAAQREAMRSAEIPTPQPTPAPVTAPERDLAMPGAIRIMRSRLMPEWARQITIQTAKECRVPLHEVIGKTTARRVCAARYQVFYLLRMHETAPSYQRIADWFCREHSGILYGAAKHALLNDLEPPTKWDVASKIVKNRTRALERKRRRKGTK